VLKKDKIKVNGVVSKHITGIEYYVKINIDGIEHTVRCKPSGKMRRNFIIIKPGDEVLVSISLYDISQGVIESRMTKKNNQGTV
jgi:translation initiation factor IF-1